MEGCRKPEGVIYQKTLRRLGVEAGEAVFLDDIGSNLKAAQDMGILTIKVCLCVCLLHGNTLRKSALNTDRLCVFLYRD